MQLFIRATLLLLLVTTPLFGQQQLTIQSNGNQNNSTSQTCVNAINNWITNCKTINYNSIIYNQIRYNFIIPNNLDVNNIDSINRKFIDYYRQNEFLLIETVIEKSRTSSGLYIDRVLSQRSKGLNAEPLLQLAAQIQPDIFASPQIEIGKTSYINPLSSDGYKFYQFSPDSSSSIQNDSIGHFLFKPIQTQPSNAFEGTIDIALKNQQIRSISVKNRLNSDSITVSIQLFFKAINDTTISADQMTSQVVMANHITKLSFPIKGEGKCQITTTSAPNDIKQQEQSVSQLLSQHQIEIQQQEQEQQRLIRFQKQLLEGYLPGGIVRIDFRKLIDYTQYEGLKLGMGLWTGDSLCQRLSAGGFFVRSFRQDRNNTGVGIKAKLNQTGNTLMAFNWSNAYNETGSFSFLDGYKQLSAESFRKFLTATMDRAIEYRLSAESIISQPLKTRLILQHSRVTPQLHYRFNLIPNLVESQFTQNEAALQLKWQTPSSLNSPTIWINLAEGNTKAETNHTYTKAESQFQISHYFYSSAKTTLRITAAKIWGKYPSTLTYSTFGSMINFGIDIPYSFNTMKLNEFAADKFIICNLRHEQSIAITPQFSPCLAITQNIGYGDVSNKQLSTFDCGFYETGLALNNLFHIGILQYGISTHYREGNYQFSKPINNFTFKFNVEISLPN